MRTFATEQLEFTGLSMVGVGLIGNDGSADCQILLVAPTARDLSNYLRSRFPDLQFDETKFLKLAITRTE
jgi:hypothetical protein